MPRYMDADKLLQLDYESLCDEIENGEGEDVVALVHAHWEEEYPQKVVRGKVLYSCECSRCGYLADYATDYCPECGAKMDE